MMTTMSGQARAKKLIQQLSDLGITNQEVLRVIAETPRHVFMPG